MMTNLLLSYLARRLVTISDLYERHIAYQKAIVEYALTIQEQQELLPALFPPYLLPLF